MLPDNILRASVLKVVGSPPMNPVVLRPTGTYQAVLSGHNQWSKTRNDVATNTYGARGLVGTAKQFTTPVSPVSPVGNIFVAGRRLRAQ